MLCEALDNDDLILGQVPRLNDARTLDAVVFAVWNAEDQQTGREGPQALQSGSGLVRHHRMTTDNEVDAPHAADKRLWPARQSVDAGCFIGERAGTQPPAQLVVVAADREPLLSIEQAVLGACDPRYEDVNHGQQDGERV